jgi:hypothetical protein
MSTREREPEQSVRLKYAPEWALASAPEPPPGSDQPRSESRPGGARPPGRRPPPVPRTHDSDILSYSGYKLFHTQHRDTVRRDDGYRYGRREAGARRLRGADRSGRREDRRRLTERELRAVTERALRSPVARLDDYRTK